MDSSRTRAPAARSSPTCTGPSTSPLGDEGPLRLPPGRPQADLARPGPGHPRGDPGHPLRPPDAGDLFDLGPDPDQAAKSDADVARLVGQGEATRADPAADERYAPDALSMLNSKGLLDLVVHDPSLNLPPSAFENDPAAELVGKIVHRQLPTVDLLQGQPAKVATPT